MTNLQRIRKESGLTQSQLAKKSGVNLKMIQKYEQGVKNINRACVTTVIKLALALKCSVIDILNEEEIESLINVWWEAHCASFKAGRF